MARPVKDLTGQTFNNLTVLGIAPKRQSGKRPRVRWRVRCTCGNEFEVFDTVLGVQKACQACGWRPKVHIPNHSYRILRAKGYTQRQIAERYNTSENTIAKKFPAEARTSWFRLHYQKLRDLLDQGLSWKECAKRLEYPGPVSAMQNTFDAWIPNVTEEYLADWMRSAHGRAYKYRDATNGAAKAHMSGSGFLQNRAKPLPALVHIMLKLDTDQIAKWLLAGLTWRDINIMLGKPVRWGAELEAIYSARLKWECSDDV